MKKQKSTKKISKLPSIQSNFLKNPILSSPTRKQVEQIRSILQEEGQDANQITDAKNLREQKLSDYSVSLDTILKTYKTDHAFTKTTEYDNLNTISQADYSLISNTLRKNKNAELHHSKIIIEKEEFKNPFQSMNILNKNKFVELFIKDLNKSRGYLLRSQMTQEIHRQLELKRRKHGYRKVNLLAKGGKESMGASKKTSGEGFKQSVVANVFDSRDGFEMQCQAIHPIAQVPESREQFVLTYIGNGDLIIFGGLQAKINSDMWLFNFIQFEWKKMKLSGDDITPRMSHTAVMYNRNVYFFGGLCKRLNHRFHPDVEVLSVDKSEVRSPNLKTKLYMKIPRGHVAVLIGSQMVVHGGYSEEDQIMSDTACLSLQPLKWSSILISSESSGPALAHHSACLVAPYEIRNSPKASLYFLPDVTNIRKAQSKITCKGIYLFGGKNKEGELCNDMWVLQLGKKPLEYLKLSISGAKPKPRFNTVMQFYEPMNYLIIHGGRNDFENDTFAFNDTWIFNLYDLYWVKVDVWPRREGDELIDRCGHASLIVKNQLVIFGGMNSNSYIGSSFVFFNLDFQFNTNVDFNDQTSILGDKPERKKTKKTL